mgnify:CR=1 FL=1
MDPDRTKQVRLTNDAGWDSRLAPPYLHMRSRRRRLQDLFGNSGFHEHLFAVLDFAVPTDADVVVARVLQQRITFICEVPQDKPVDSSDYESR